MPYSGTPSRSQSGRWGFPEVGPYVPGQFSRRELDPLLQGIAAPVELSLLVIDAYVDLGEDQVPGLGWVLHDRSDLPVIGVAKSPYPGTPQAQAVLRGASGRLLFVSTAGVDLDEAKALVARMAGDGRIPTMLRRADRLSRTGRPG